MAKIKIADVAKALGVSPETVRIGLQMGVYDFGVAFKKPNRRNYTYTLFPEKVKEICGDLRNEE